MSSVFPRRFQRRNSRIQEHKFYSLGCWWPGQNKTPLAPLFPKYARFVYFLYTDTVELLCNIYAFSECNSPLISLRFGLMALSSLL